jgi:hypothetical protein
MAGALLVPGAAHDDAGQSAAGERERAPRQGL